MVNAKTALILLILFVLIASLLRFLFIPNIKCFYTLLFTVEIYKEWETSSGFMLVS